MRAAVLVLCYLILAGCMQQITGMAVSQEGERSMKVLFIVAQKDFRDEELAEPKKIVEKAGHMTRIASITADNATGMLGMKVTPDVAVARVNVTDYDMFVVVGGRGTPTLADHPEVFTLLQDAQRKGKYIGGICLGPTILSKAGILEGRRATVFPTDQAIEILEEGGAVYLNEQVVRDGKIITANGPAAARAFGTAIVEMFGE